MSAIIDVSEIKESKCIEWKIPQFFKASHDIEVYKRPILLFQKECSLIVYPRGAYGTTPDYVIIALYLKNPYSNISVNLLLDVEGCEEAVKCKTKEGNEDDGHYKIWSWLYENAKLKTKLNDDVLRGKVMISCKEGNSNSSSTAAAACQTTFLCNTVHFYRDFQDLLLSGRKSDASIEVHGRLFKVHKLILEACSPVFLAMFDNDMSEKNTGIVRVDDCDPRTFHNFLKCLYSGKLENTSQDSLIGLYKLSDKYCVSELKGKCSEIMVQALSEDTVFEVLAAADMCNDAQLKSSAETFLIKNIKTIFRTERWKKMQSENPSCIVEILIKVFEEKNSCTR